jgi:hypothetical protein
VARREWVPVFARINTSAKLVALPNDTYRLFYMMLLPQCDGWGRAPADPGVLDAIVWPRFKWAVDVAGDALAACEAVGLVEVHQTDSGERFVQVTGWEHKAGKLYNHLRRGASEWPDPSPESRVSRDSLATSCAALASSCAERARPPLLSSPLAVVSPPAVSALEASQARPPANGRKDKKQPAGDHADAIAHWHAEFLRTRGSEYAFAGKRDGAHVSALLKAAGLVAFKARATALLDSQDPFYRDKGCDLGTLRAAWNKLAAPKAPQPSYMRPDEPEAPRVKVDPVIAKRAIQAAIAASMGKPVL